MLYFVGAVCVGEALYVVMRWSKGAPVSTVLTTVAAVATWLVIPLLDAMPQHIISPKALSTTLVLTVLVKGYDLVWCKANTAQCHAFFNDFTWDQSIKRRHRPAISFNTTSHNVTDTTNPILSNATSPTITLTTEPIVSTIDIRNSTHSLILVLCLTMLASNLMSPKTSNCIKEPFKMTDLHGEITAPGKGSIASKLFGERMGQAHALFVSQVGTWTILPAVVCEVVSAVHDDSGGSPLEATRALLAACAHLIICCTWGPAQHLPTLKKLVTMAGCWYYVLVLCAGGACHAMMQAQHGAAVVYSIIYTCSMLIGLPGMDAIPPALLPQRLRIVLFGTTTAIFLTFYVGSKISATCGPGCPKGNLRVPHNVPHNAKLP